MNMVDVPCWREYHQCIHFTRIQGPVKIIRESPMDGAYGANPGYSPRTKIIALNYFHHNSDLATSH